MDFQLGRGMPGMPQVPQQLPMLLFAIGAVAVGFGFAVLVYEWLLRWLVAGVFVLVGVVLWATAARAKRMLG